MSATATRDELIRLAVAVEQVEDDTTREALDALVRLIEVSE